LHCFFVVLADSFEKLNSFFKTYQSRELMQLSLSGLVPVPLREKMNARQSGVWQQQILFAPGAAVFIQAPSGTGKTTLMHVLYGLRRDYEGQVHWGNNELKKLDAAALAKLRAGAVSIIFQDLRLFPELTTWENLSVKRLLTNTVSEAELLGWLERLGIKDKKDALAKTLSYGEQQRVAIIRALLQPFQWLLMDEPFSHLDKANTEKAAALILEIVQRNKASFILVDLDENDHFPYSQKISL
jgi:ABC-type lipoprotein export system ATPase subunit